jgi:rare lipoprotein A
MASKSLLCLVVTATLALSANFAEARKAQIHAHSSGPQSGIASVYSGGRTANGERAHAHGMTAAHRTLPFGTKVRVTNKRNGKTVVVRINDRGPFIRGRIIDLSTAAAGVIGMKGAGVARVTVERLGG